MAYDKNKNYQEEIEKAVSRGDYASASKYEQERNEKIDAEGLSYAKTNNYSYDKNANYQAMINDAVGKGDYASASKYEQMRNLKIDTEGLSYDKTNNYTIPSGVNGNTYNKLMSSFSPSSNVTNADSVANKALSTLENLTSKDNIIGADVWSGIYSNFVVPSAVTMADSYLSEQLKKIQSGRTSYTNQLNEILNAIQNREKFSYDVDADPLFQQALASAMNHGKEAMQDTIGQASALTGGYGSTYATSAGNQAYNSFIEDAYDNLPQYYQMALEAYQMEGDEMYRQFGMISDLDDKEYNRNIMAYDATFQHRNQMYNEAYNHYRDKKSDSFAMANLQLNEHGQKVNDAFNFYSASSDYAENLYAREYASWNDGVNQALQLAEMLNSDYWNQSNQDFQASESEKQRVWESNENQVQRDWQASESQKDRDFTASESEKQRVWESAENDEQREFTSSENQKDREFTATENQKDRDLTVSEGDKNRSVKSSSGGGGGGSGSGGGGGKGDLKDPTENQMKKALDAYNAEGMAGLNKYLNSVPNTYNKDAIAQYVGQYGVLPYSQRTYTVVDDGGWNGGWGVDNNAVVKDQYGNQMTLKELAKHDKAIALELSDKKYTKGSTYTKK